MAAVNIFYGSLFLKGEVMESILVVDDEKEIADLVELYLRGDGYSIHKFYNATDAIEFIHNNEVSLAILDVMLPDMSGFDLCIKIRQEHLFPIIMLTAKIEDVDKIIGLTLGADDYITKPFNPLELVARVKTQLRRYTRYNDKMNSMSTVTNDEYDIRGLHISKGRRKCTVNGKDINLTPFEFDILWYLCENKGQVVSSEQLFEAVWKEKYFESNNTVMTHIARLREKMGEVPRKPKYVKTVWGVGYIIE